jgi:hypothetical protein
VQQLDRIWVGYIERVGGSAATGGLELANHLLSPPSGADASCLTPGCKRWAVKKRRARAERGCAVLMPV